MNAATIERPGRYVTFVVHGTPAPAGSKRAFAHRSTGRIVVTDDSKRSRPWKQAVAAEAAAAMTGPLLEGPLELIVVFTMPRPKGHYGTGANAARVKASAPAFPTVKPDATKLVRAVEDAMTGIVWRDDAQVIAQHVHKVYGDAASCVVEVLSLEPAELVACPACDGYGRVRGALPRDELGTCERCGGTGAELATAAAGAGRP